VPINRHLLGGRWSFRSLSVHQGLTCPPPEGKPGQGCGNDAQGLARKFKNHRRCRIQTFLEGQRLTPPSTPNSNRPTGHLLQTQIGRRLPLCGCDGVSSLRSLVTSTIHYPDGSQPTSGPAERAREEVACAARSSQSLPKCSAETFQQTTLFRDQFSALGKQVFGEEKDLCWTSCTTTIRRALRNNH